MKPENIYITWHFTTHGLAYLKHIISAFYANKVSYSKLNCENISQVEMNDIFTLKSNGFLFNKIYYITANQEVFDKISTRRFNYKTRILEDEEILKTNTYSIWKRIIDLQFDNLNEEINFVKSNYSEKKYELWFSQIWRNIHQYTINEQIIWFRRYSNAHRNYKELNVFEEIKTNVNDLRDSTDIARNLNSIIKELKEKHQNANFIINASLGSNETQVVWQVFSELNFLPQNTKLIQCYDDKIEKAKRFKRFNIKEIPSKIISLIHSSLQLFDYKQKTKKRKVAELKMQHYIKSGFAVLIIGERGIGKSRLVENYKGNNAFIPANCASFSDDTMAESELFGHKKGAFTGANTDNNGLFLEAENGILFLDEIHHLSHRVQAKLMKAIETDKYNRLSIRPLGSSNTVKLQTTLIFATNQKIEKLRKTLLPDFYDRISQQVIELPPLRTIPEQIPEEFRNTWHHMKFDLSYSFSSIIQNDKELFDWLKNLKLYGNYRDLQKIAIFYKNFLDFSPETKKVLSEKNAFQFAKNEFLKYISENENAVLHNSVFSENKTVREMEINFKKQLANWAIEKFKGAPNAAKHFRELGGKTTEETIYRWKKGL